LEKNLRLMSLYRQNFAADMLVGYMEGARSALEGRFAGLVDLGGGELFGMHRVMQFTFESAHHKKYPGFKPSRIWKFSPKYSILID
jgi:hypothetical protein